VFRVQYPKNKRYLRILKPKSGREACPILDKKQRSYIPPSKYHQRGVSGSLDKDV
jgi:hypothetical protein